MICISCQSLEIPNDISHAIKVYKSLKKEYDYFYNLKTWHGCHNINLVVLEQKVNSARWKIIEAIENVK